MKTGAYLTLLFLLAKSTLVFGQWKSLGPNGAYIKCHLQFDNKIFIGTSTSGVFASEDYGHTWEPKNNGLNGSNITCLIKENNRLFVSSESNGDVFYSDNFGDSWHLFSTLPEKISTTIFKNDSGFFIGANGGLYRSNNNGINWNRIDSGIFFPQYFTIRCITNHNGAIYVGSNTGVYKSNDLGVTWNRIVNGIFTNATVVSILPYGNKLYAASSKGCYTSYDEGLSWNLLNEGLGDTSLRTMLIYAGEITTSSTKTGEIFQLDTITSKWQKISQTPTEVGILNNLTSVQENLIAFSEFGVFRNNFNPNIWVPSNQGLSGSAITTIEPINGYLFTSMFYIGGLTYRFDSSIWSAPFLKSNLPTSFLLSGNKIFSSLNDATNLGVGYTLDSGKTWLQSNNGITHKKGLLICRLGENLYYASTLGGVYRSTNNGANWIQFNDSLIDLKLNFAYCNEEDFLVANSRGVYSYDTTTLNWKLLFSPENDTIKVMGGSKLNLICQGAKGALYKVCKEGQLTYRLDFDSTIKVNCVRFVNELLFMGTSNGLFLSKDSGDHWESANWGMHPGTNVFDVKFTKSHVFCATNYGVWERELDKLTGINLISSKPNLVACYPNPTTDKINFSFGSNQTFKGKLSYSIYDISGKLIMKIDEINFTDSSLEINVASLSPGLYFIAIEFNSEVLKAKFMKK
ncbi:MAG: T9SS type A sorting domain-containing protein [Bacteroidia bacterium]|nr:T9SS type A sorting domain-containing protein [Bacteroidia bacterium]